MSAQNISTPEQNSWAENVGCHLNDVVYNLIVHDPSFDYGILKKCYETSHTTEEYLAKLKACGFDFSESQILSQAIKNLGIDSMELILPWLVQDLLPRLQKSMERIEALERRDQEVSASLANLLQCPSMILPYKDGVDTRRTLPEALSQWQEKSGKDCLREAVADEATSPDCRLEELINRVQYLEQLHAHDEDHMKLNQQIERCEDLGSRIRALEDKIENIQPAFTTLSDASITSTGTLTPASTMNVQDREVVVEYDRSIPKPLTLLVRIWSQAPIKLSSLCQAGNIAQMMIRINPHTQFKPLLQKLNRQHNQLGHDFELILCKKPQQHIFESDTPASVGLKDREELVFANIKNGARTFDMTGF